MYLLDKELKSEFQNNWESTGMPGPQQCGPLTQTEKWDGSVLKAGGGSRGRKRRPAVWGPLCLFAYPSIYLQITKLCCYNTLWNCIEIMQMILSLYGSTSQQHTQKSHKHSVETLIQMLNFVFVFFPDYQCVVLTLWDWTIAASPISPSAVKSPCAGTP